MGLWIWNFLIRSVTKLASWTCVAFWHGPVSLQSQQAALLSAQLTGCLSCYLSTVAKSCSSPPPPYMHLLASNIFSALFLFDLYNDVGLFSHLADNHESSGLWSEESGDEENYLWSWSEWVTEDKLWVISAGDDPENGVWAQLVTKTEIPLA